MRETRRTPNILLILADDLGYGDLGCYGNSLHKTPNIDALAGNGLRFTDCYASAAWCVPSRAGLLTGRHPYRTSMKPWQQKPLPTTIASFLSERGYATGLIGKWHLGMGEGCHPLDQGFDSFYGTPGSNDTPAPAGKSHNYNLFRTCNKYTFPVELYKMREMVECPADQELFIQRYTTAAKEWIVGNRGNPFFLYLAHNAPHVPVFPSSDFRGISDGGPYGDVVEELDWSVGELMKTLDQEGLRDDTIIIFTSDNGPWTMFWEFGGTAAPLRGEKTTCWEGGPRVPAIVSLPGTIDQAVSGDFVVHTDLYATIAAMVGQPLPKDSPHDSVDFSAVLLGAGPSRRTSCLFYAYDIPFAYRSGTYKLHMRSIDRTRDPLTCAPSPVTEYDPPLLFDLGVDICEKRNIASERPDVVERLTKECSAEIRRISEG